MKGTILDCTEKGGVISGDDGNRYTFTTDQLNGSQQEFRRAAKVDFAVENGTARDIYLAVESSIEKNKIVAGLLALFFGTLGIHKFYLGYMKEGVIMLLVFMLGFILLGIPSFVIAIIALVEAIIYLMKSDSDFQRIYVDRHKGWF